MKSELIELLKALIGTMIVGIESNSISPDFAMFIAPQMVELETHLAEETQQHSTVHEFVMASKKYAYKQVEQDLAEIEQFAPELAQQLREFAEKEMKEIKPPEVKSDDNDIIANFLRSYNDGAKN